MVGDPGDCQNMQSARSEGDRPSHHIVEARVLKKCAECVFIEILRDDEGVVGRRVANEK